MARQKLRASPQMSETRNVEISLTEPWFLNRRLPRPNSIAGNAATTA